MKDSHKPQAASDRRRGALRCAATVLLVACSLQLVAGVVEACPGCKEALFDPRDVRATIGRARGYAWSIALMLTMPVLLIGGVTTWVVAAQRRARPRSGARDVVDTPPLPR